ncbi:hypothetical protein KKE19_01495 [Patescibacteria group bacterium]|nr:hypothetical protein [Patescibacteria group bacterium]MBU4274467.1 hypothetical protein [Patescibacteria group bacterium]MBU4367934.1 hypothetical protein [Patescibacteria group bacterium]MBU4462272.1 hypothetical protein [Patescibacteria group bacterium]MCG2699544.1 hypothetical protein [Candidatus Parcubacteria bacterium]
MSAKDECTWYVEPLDKLTNESLARELPEENFQPGTIISDGTRHNLWRCDFAIVANLRSDGQFHFRIFNRYGNGQIRQCRFFKRKKRPKASAKLIPPQ